MKKFIKKHLYTIIYMVVLFLLIFFYSPNQKSYYLKADIDVLNDGPYYIYMLYTLIGFVVFIFLLFIIKRKNILESLKNTLIVSLYAIVMSFFISSVFTAFFLMINRSKTITTVTKEYEVMNGFLIELKTGKHIDFDELKPFLSRKEIKEFDNKKYVHLKFKRGLLDIDFLTKK